MKGLTLIETLVYFALLTLLMFATVSLASSVSGAGERDREAVLRSEEWSFALRKLEWAAARAYATDATETEVRMRSDVATLDPITVRIENDSMMLSVNGEEAIPILLLDGVDELRFENIERGFVLHASTSLFQLDRPFLLP